MDRDEYIEALKNYKKACLYMKRINSNKANRYSIYLVMCNEFACKSFIIKLLLGHYFYTNTSHLSYPLS